MTYLSEYINGNDIKAETLVSLLDLKADFQAQAQGIFSRSYSEDMIDIENEIDISTITLSRDGIFHLLPEGLFFKENRLKEDGKRNFDFKKEYDEFKKKKKEILVFFKPFDTTFFKLNLELEHTLNDFAKRGNDIFVRSFLGTGYEIQWGDREGTPLRKSQIPNPKSHIPNPKTLLPFVAKIRGNHLLLIDILKNILSVDKIEIKEIQLFHARFIIHKEGLSKEEYQTMDNDLAVFFDFFAYWFLPFERKYDYRIKDFKQPFKLGTSLILDYNTHL